MSRFNFEHCCDCACPSHLIRSFGGCPRAHYPQPEEPRRPPPLPSDRIALWALVAAAYCAVIVARLAA